MYLTQGHYRLILASVVALLAAGCQQAPPPSSTLGNLPGPRVDDDVDPKVNATTYFSHGHLLERQGHFERAAVQYQKALTQRPGFLTARNRLGITLNKLGRHEEASAQFQVAIAKHPELAYLHNNLGFSLYLEGKYHDAGLAIKQALAINAEFRRAHMNYALVLARQAQFEQAFEHLLEAGSESNAYFNMGIMLTEAERFGDAAQYLEAALTLNPKFEAARQQLHEVARLAAEKEAIDAAKLAVADFKAELDAPQATASEGTDERPAELAEQTEQQLAVGPGPTVEQDATLEDGEAQVVTADPAIGGDDLQETPAQANVAVSAAPGEQVVADDLQDNWEDDPNCWEIAEESGLDAWQGEPQLDAQWGPPTLRQQAGWAASGEGGDIDLELLQEMIDAAYWALIEDSDQQEWLWCELSYYLFPETAPDVPNYPLAEDDWEDWQSPVMYYVESGDEEMQQPTGK